MPARRTALRWMLAVVAALVLVPAGAVALIAWLGVLVDAGPWRATVAGVASEALGRRVTLEGPVELSLGLRSALRIGGIRIANPPGFSEPEFASLGDVSAEVDLIPALRGRLRIHSLAAENVRLRLERAADGRFNWDFGALLGVADEEAEAAPETGPGPAVAVRIRRLALRSLAVEYRDAGSQRSRYFDLDELVGDAPWNAALRMTVRGRVEKKFPYRLTLQGGPARALYRAGEPWPFEIDFEFVDTRLHATGSTDTGTGETRVDVGLGTANLAELERLLEIRLPRLGMTAVAAVVAHRGQALDIDIVRGVVGDSEVTGRLRIEVTTPRPRVTGELAIATFDLRPFLGGDPAAEAKPFTFRELEKQALSANVLGALDADVALTVGRWLGLPTDVRDARLTLRIADGKLRAPIEARIAEVPLAGRLDLDAAAGVPTVALELGARNSPLGNLAEALTGLRGVAGTLGRFDLRVAGRGDTVGALVRNLEARVTAAGAKLTYGNVAGGRPVDLALETFEVSIPRGATLRGSARGALRGAPVTARIQGGSLATMLREARSAIEIVLDGAGASARISGAVAHPGAPGGTDIEFRLEGRRAGDLAAWLGTSPNAAAPVALRGRFRAAGDDWHLEDFKLTFGRSELAIDAHETGSGAASFVIAAVRSPLIDVPELQSLFADRTAGPKASRTEIDIPILPKGIDLADADIGVGIERVVLGRGDLANVAVAARVRGGRMGPSPFGATFAGTPFGGTVALDLRGEVPEAGLTMSAEKVALGKLLQALRIADDLDATVDSLTVELNGRGSRLLELLERSSFAAKLQGGRLRVRGPGNRVVANLRLAEATAAAEPGRPVAVRLEGALNRAPVGIRIASGTLADFAQDSKHVPFSLTAESAGARLALDGRVTLPMNEATADLKLVLSGERLDALNRLTRTALPPWGPWSLAGPLRITATAYDVPELAVTVGSSRLAGAGRLDLGGDKPRLDVSVRSPRLQLDDFRLAGWSAFAAPRAEDDADLEALRAQIKEAAEQTEALASARVLSRFDGYLDVEVSEVLSGADRLGSGRLRLQLENGRLLLGPAEVNAPGGTARFAGAYTPSEHDVLVALGAYVERFDYGILARRIRPDAGAEGLVSLELELAARAPALSALMAHASGRVDIAVWPRNLSSGTFDLWAVNVFLALLPELDPSTASRVNCAFGRFDLRDGKLSEEALLIDTSRIRVTGRGGVDFADETLAFRFEPRAKVPQPFGLATPVEVTGTLTDFHVGPSVVDALATVPRFLGSLILAPLGALGVELVPRDGRDVCADPLRAPRAVKR
jgi:AsmA family protein